jgi:hypothetical protein
MSPEATRSVPLPVLLVAAGPAKQQRWTVLIRWIMLIPHFVVLYFLFIAAEVVAFIGWWGALFTGQLPEFAVNFLSGVVRWYTRVQAYALLLTDAYPPFSLDDVPGYPVRIAIPPADKLNRAAVFFRFILVIPAYLLYGIVSFGGTTIVAFIAWIITLITGKLPAPLHQAYTAILRYGTRYISYFVMLTPAYPRGLFGDGPAVPGGAAAPPAGGYFDPAASGGQAPAGPGVVPGYEAPADLGYGVPGYETPVDLGYRISGYEVGLGYGGSGYETPGGQLAAGQPADWRLLLTRGARQLVGWFIAIGVVLYVADAVVSGIVFAHSTNSIVTTRNAIDRVNAAQDTLNSAMSNYQTTAQACATVACTETADGQAAAAFDSFASTLHSTPMPAGAVAAANALYSDSITIAQGFTQLSQLSPTASVAEYQSTYNSAGLAAAANKFQTDGDALTTALNNAR